jgi:hypothetical protein
MENNKVINFIERKLKQGAIKYLQAIEAEEKRLKEKKLEKERQEARRLEDERIRNLKPWDGRYNVIAIVREYEHRGCTYKNVYMTLFQTDMPDDEVRSLMISIGLTADDPYLNSVTEETFTEEQAKRLIAYIEGNHKDTEVYMKPAMQPEPHQMGVGAIPVGGGTDFYMFCKEPEYNLDFKVYGYFDVRHDVRHNEYIKQEPPEGYGSQSVSILKTKVQEEQDLDCPF